ncbi:MAG: MFS transporter [Bacteroidetes bacterium]|nr:MFS transporter [Bacteroidota bacterium]
MNWKKLSTFFCLYIIQAIPMSFFSTAIPVIMRQNSYSLASIGLLQLIKIPWIIKFLWSPLVDRNTNSVLSYKRWIIYSEIFYAVTILLISFFDLEIHFPIIIALLVFAFFASATQDIATDAFAIVSFKKGEMSMLNSMQSMGSFAGALIGSGVLLLVYNAIGWTKMLPMLSLVVLLAISPLCLLYKNRTTPILHKQKANKLDMFIFFSQKHIYKQIGFLLLFYSGIIGMLAMVRPYFVDNGYSMKEIGIMSGVVGTSVACVCAFFSGQIIKKIGIYYSRILYATIIFLSSVYFYILSQIGTTTPLMYIGVILLWASYGLASVLVYTSSMQMVRSGREGTDFTIQTVLTHFSGMIVAICGGKIADIFNYEGLFVFEMILGAISLLYILLLFKKEKNNG